MTKDKDLISYLLLLRFGDEDNALSKTPILNFKSIAKVVKKPLQTVRRLILLGLKALSEQREIK